MMAGRVWPDCCSSAGGMSDRKLFFIESCFVESVEASRISASKAPLDKVATPRNGPGLVLIPDKVSSLSKCTTVIDRHVYI